MINWDITRSSSAYAAFAGILAGFIFSSIGFILYNTPSDKISESDSRQPTLVWLITAFFSLLISSFLFSVISGDDYLVQGTTKISVIPYYTGIIATLLLILAAFQVILGLL